MRTHSNRPVQDRALTSWQPDFTWWTSWNTKAHENFLPLSDEWQSFVASRIKEDFHLLQAIGCAKAPEAIWTAYTCFWQKAIEDYWAEYTRLAKLCGIFHTGMADAAHPAEPPVHAKAA